MPTEFRIAVLTRTTSGFDTIGEFFIGSDREDADQLFKRLKGSPDDFENGVLLMDLRELNHSLLLDIHMILCTLDQVADNCRLITKHQFKARNLKLP